MLGQVIKNVVGGGNNGGKREIKGKVVLMFKIVLDSDAIKVPGPVLDVWGLLVFLKLVSADQQQEDGSGKVGEGAHLEKGGPLAAGETEFQVSFKWEEGFGIPGAVIVENNHPNHIGNEFYLKAVTLEDVPGHGRVHFVCNSWVYPAIISLDKDRVFFSNKTYLPHEMPIALQKYREEELVALRGDGKGERKQWDRIYDYASYNDLADLPLHRRPILGGSDEFPYPRRGRTGRLPSLFDPEAESNVSLESGLNIYVPRDERFDHLKMSDFLGDGVKSLAHFIRPALETLFDREYESFEEVLKLYHGGIKFPAGPLLQAILDNIPSELLRQIFHVDSAGFFKYPVPQVIKEDKSAWRTDEEFAREMLAGVHPIFVRLLKEFPPTSKLDRKQYGNQNSTITTAQIENKLDGLTVEQAMKGNRLFILDHHDALMPYLGRINGTSTKTYATRTVLFLKNDGTLKPLAIELSLPDARGDEFGAVSKVYGPAEEGVEGSIWQLAKAYVGVNDAGYHQLISHWLHTHAVMEPFVIATNRQLSVVHPIYKLLHPHFRDTMFINAFARQALVNAGGLLESTHFQGRYAMELSSMIYKKWVFLDQALPRDLKKRGIAVDDPQAKHGLRLLIKDYPFAVDGLEIWSAIQKWVQGYCSFYYKTDKMVQEDPELQSWWKEIREEGHGDKRHEQDGWPKMQTLEDLIEASTIIIWIASALHAAVNFGQYPYGGYMPVRPTISRRFMPEKGSPKYAELESNPDQVFLKTITAQPQALLGISLIEILSRHASDEVYLGKRDTPEWTTDEAPLAAFEDFGKRLSEIEEEIIDKNKDEKLKNRVGPVNVPYTLLFPSSEAGLTGKGIPNSISI